MALLLAILFDLYGIHFVSSHAQRQQPRDELVDLLLVFDVDITMYIRGRKSNPRVDAHSHSLIQVGSCLTASILGKGGEAKPEMSTAPQLQFRSSVHPKIPQIRMPRLKRI